MAHTYQWPLSTMLMQQPLPMPSQQPGKEFKVDSRFDDIMSLNFGKNPIVQKYEDLNNSIDYRFKFRGEDVCITLSPGALFTILHVDGNGGDTWWNEANSILYEQFKRLQSRDQEQGADPGENKKPLVSEEDFRKCFAIPYAYGTNGPNWSHETILLYKYSSNATTKYWHIPEDTWKKIVNKYGQHAEEIMIEDLKDIQDYLTIQPDDNEGSYKAILSVEVILSYSPCGECSQSVCLLKETMDKKVKERKTRNKDTDYDTFFQTFDALSLTKEVEDEEKVEFKITFSNFYKHLELYQNENIEGLKNLLRSDIKLDVFSDDNWHYFFNAAGLVTKRQRRERDDKKILQYLEVLVTSERIPAIEQDLRKNKLL